MSHLKKKCFKCLVEKNIDDFYRHKNMSMGVLNKCKSCCKTESKNNYLEKSKCEDFLENERKRTKERYHRLNYKDKQKIWDSEKPWKTSSVYKNLSRKLKPKKGIELHHWSYNDKDLEDIFFMNRRNHRKLHSFIELDLKSKYYKYNDILLDTKEKHFKVINSLKLKTENG